MTIRAFLAVEIPENVRDSIAELMRRLQKGAMFTQAAIAWTRPEAIHLTIAFLGDIEDNIPARIGERLAAPCAALAPINYAVRGLGFFPGEHRPRVLWTGVRKADAPFRALHDLVAGQLSPLGIKPETRPFTPHLTLARLKSGKDAPAILDLAKNYSRHFLGDATATELTLFQSDLRPEGAKHTPLHRFPFKNALE